MNLGRIGEQLVQLCISANLLYKFHLDKRGSLFEGEGAGKLTRRKAP